jgi:excisionase family DNA binding protein
MPHRLPADTPAHLTTFQVARLLGVAVRSVQLMVNRDELQAWKTPGGHRRITRESLQAWLLAHPEHRKGTTTLADPTAPPPSQAAEPRRAARSGRPVVLLIEDSIHYQNLVRLLVETSFPEVDLRTANDGLSGMALFGELKPDVLVVDLLLPGIDGATLIGALRTHPAFHAARLIIVTSLTAEEIQKYRFVLQGVTVIHKTDLVNRLPQELQLALAGQTAEAGMP